MIFRNLGARISALAPSRSRARGTRAAAAWRSELDAVGRSPRWRRWDDVGYYLIAAAFCLAGLVFLASLLVRATNEKPPLYDIAFDVVAYLVLGLSTFGYYMRIFSRRRAMRDIGGIA